MLMNDKLMTKTLKQLAEDAVPGNTDLWPGLAARIDARPGAPAHLKGRLTMNTPYPHTARLRWMGLSTLAVVAVAAVLLVTPQGRALAQSVWLFFNPAASEAFVVSEALGAAEPSVGPTAAAPSFAADVCGADLTCQLAAAEAAIGFDARVLPSGSSDLTWNYVEAYPEGGTLRLGYAAAEGGGLVLSQSLDGLPTSKWEAVPAGAAVAVTVNGQPAEYVEGTFVVYPGSTEAVWNADAPVQRLRWRAEGVLYELTKMGDPQSLEHLDMAAMVALAESLE
jgi:hypothetical protein